YDRLAAREKTRDIYRLLRVGEGVELGFAELEADVARWQAALGGGGEGGALAERTRTLAPGEVVEEALRMFRGYHTRPVAERIADSVIVRDVRLCFYYQNRTAHIAAVAP